MIERNVYETISTNMSQSYVVAFEQRYMCMPNLLSNNFETMRTSDYNT